MNEELIKRLREDDTDPVMLKKAADTIEAQAAEIERLREALEPFRMVAYDYEGTRPCMAVNININLLRAARAALGETE
jgi:hypothetical protein